jgi:hypothetical protein
LKLAVQKRNNTIMLLGIALGVIVLGVMSITIIKTYIKKKNPIKIG